MKTSSCRFWCAGLAGSFLALQSSACTLVGAGVGAAVPRGYTIPGPELHHGAIATGEAIEVECKEQGACRGSTYFGTYRFIHGPYLVYESEGRKRFEIPLSEIEEVRVRHGDHAAEGAWVGLHADKAWVSLLAGLAR